MKIHNLFENAVDHQQIKDWLKLMKIKKYTIDENGVVDVEGNVQIAGRDLTYIPVQFGYVSGFFYCGQNQLTSLKGCPREVGREFSCRNNQLTGLKGAPREVGGTFICSQNHLTSLQYSPREVGKDFNCSGNLLTNLQGAPREVGGDFYCFNNELTSLQGSPEIVGGCFHCHHNKLTDLQGAPTIVGEDFYCAYNRFTFVPDHSFIDIRGPFFPGNLKKRDGLLENASYLNREYLRYPFVCGSFPASLGETIVFAFITDIPPTITDEQFNKLVQVSFDPNKSSRLLANNRYDKQAIRIERNEDDIQKWCTNFRVDVTPMTWKEFVKNLEQSFTGPLPMYDEELDDLR